MSAASDNLNQNADQAWPIGCHDTASCEYHRVCMYHQCQHTGKGAALGTEVDAAIAAIASGKADHVPQTTENLLLRCRQNPRWASEEIARLRADVPPSARDALKAIRQIAGGTHTDSPARERPYTALSEIDQIARKALA